VVLSKVRLDTSLILEKVRLDTSLILEKVRLDTSLILEKEDCERIDNWWRNVIDKNGHFDKTKDRIFLKRFKKEYPKQYKELIKAIET